MYKHLLVPVDGTELTDKAMRDSIELATRLQSKITAFVAEPTPPLPTIGNTPQMIEKAYESHDQRTTDHATEVIRKFKTAAREAGIKFSGHYVQAHNVEDAIVAAADEHGCDLIVMVTHGRGLLGELMFGAHTKGVLARSKLPLLVLH
jgi:nucleotide-binding universal stress UspA family protein